MMLVSAWHLSWQDPAALLLVVLGLALSLWLRRRLVPAGGCGGCAKAAPPPVLIPTARLIRHR